MEDESFDSGGDTNSDVGSDVSSDVGNDTDSDSSSDFASDDGVDLNGDVDEDISDGTDTNADSDESVGDDLNTDDVPEAESENMEQPQEDTEEQPQEDIEEQPQEDTEEQPQEDIEEQPQEDTERPDNDVLQDGEPGNVESSEDSKFPNDGGEGDNIPPPTPTTVSYLMNQDDFGGFKIEGHTNRNDFGNDASNYNIKTGEKFTTESDGIMLEQAPDGTFVLPSDQMDTLIDRSQNDTANFAAEINGERALRGLPPIEEHPNRILENQLGKPYGSLGNGPVIRYDENVTDITELSTPQGGESTNNGMGVATGLNEYLLKNPTAFDVNKISIYNLKTTKK